MNEREIDELWAGHLAEALDGDGPARLGRTIAADPALGRALVADARLDSLLAGVGTAQRTAEPFIVRTANAMRGSPPGGGGGGVGRWVLAAVAALTAAGGAAWSVHRTRATRPDPAALLAAAPTETASTSGTPVAAPPSAPPRFVPAPASHAGKGTTFEVIAALAPELAGTLTAHAPFSGGWYFVQPELLRCVGHQHYGGMRLVAGLASGDARAVEQGLAGFEVAARWLAEHEGQPQPPWCMGPLVSAWAEALDALERAPAAAALEPRIAAVTEALANAEKEIARDDVRRFLSSRHAKPAGPLVSVGAALLAMGTRRQDAKAIAEGRTYLESSLARRQPGAGWDQPLADCLLALRHLHAVFHLLEPSQRVAVLQAGRATLAGVPAELPRTVPRPLVRWVRALHETRAAEP